MVINDHHRFCFYCGQKAREGRITGKSLFRDFFYFFTHAERGVFNLFKGLAVRPGKVAAEYVEGKRKTYFNPFTFLALCIAFTAFLNSQLKPYGDPAIPDARVLARIPTEKVKNLYLLTVKKIEKVTNIVNKNLNLISVAVTPYFAFCLWIFFKGRGRNFAEICVAYILFTGFTNVVTTVLLSPVLAMSRNTGAFYPILYSSLALQTLYFSWGMKGFFNYKTAGGYFKVLAVLGIGGLVGLLVVIFAYFMYVYRGEAMQVLQYLGPN